MVKVYHQPARERQFNDPSNLTLFNMSCFEYRNECNQEQFVMLHFQLSLVEQN